MGPLSSISWDVLKIGKNILCLKWSSLVGIVYTMPIRCCTMPYNAVKLGKNPTLPEPEMMWFFNSYRLQESFHRWSHVIFALGLEHVELEEITKHHVDALNRISPPPPTKQTPADVEKWPLSFWTDIRKIFIDPWYRRYG